MSTTRVETPTSRCLFGIGRCDITPPVGIYHRFWGAAAHDQATGVHRPLTATVLLLQSLDGDRDPLVLIALDHCMFRPSDMQSLLHETGQRVHVPTDRILFAFSHTHAGGHICRQRGQLPGGEMIGPYLDGLPEKLSGAFQTAADSLSPATLTYATGQCDMGRHRDYWDAQRNQFVCGFNPDHPAGLAVHVVRVSNEKNNAIAMLVSYPCHPTTLAWNNTLISPDYVGAMREVVEGRTDVPCVFFLSPCGDIGPKYGYVGDVAIADRNGRQLAFAALSALESMPPPTSDYEYVGPVTSGATLGNWVSRPMSPQRLKGSAVFRHRAWVVELPYRPGLPSAADAERQLAQLVAEEDAARAGGQEDEAGRLRALAERKRRWLERVHPLPAGDRYPLRLSVWQMGDAVWVAVEGEPYHALQEELAKRFPNNPLIVITLTNGSRCSYLPTRDAYEKPLYQTDVAILAPGCLEMITDAVASQIDSWLRE